MFKTKSTEAVDATAATMTAINQTLKKRGGVYSGYSCKTVSWDDCSRGQVGGGLSCWGSNITDTYLKAKDGRNLFTVRADNWNESLGKSNSEGIAFVGTRTGGGGGVTNLKPYTLKDFLKDPKGFGGYANLDVSDLSDDVLDKDISVRFQTTFLPVPLGERQTCEFATEAYNYNTTSDSDPRNLVLLCTSQGVAVQQDGAGCKQLYHHCKGEGGEVKRYWLEAESTDHKVGGEQRETPAEREDALRRGKATSSVIGTPGCGTRFNVLMTIQVPLKQREKTRSHELAGCAFGEGGGSLMSCSFMDSDVGDPPFGASLKSTSKGGGKRKQGSRKGDRWEGLSVSAPSRHPDEHITVTVVMYYVVQGGTPGEEDVVNAVDDLEELLRQVGGGKLAGEGFEFMKKELTVKDALDIKEKIETQPPKPEKVGFFDSFPSFGGGLFARK
ncbi:hypothetical protein TrRE_jg2728 [Triparma retinervis]|uniref:Uncharacterized protein n=1 Tax=Triparma retinervis TaxID=2557542 RepID=A0A9W7F7S1_9STRA|nr:hypothetical protein TrRE_jg2728 [Triparma retinervis]